MMPLTYPNVDLSWIGLDRVGCGCSSSRCGISLAGISGRSLTKSGCISERLPCRQRKVANCRMSSAETTNVMLNSSALESKPNSGSTVTVSSLLETVTDDLQTLNKNLKSIIGAENPVLVSAAEQIFGAGGKRLRPAMVFLVARATSKLAGLKDLTPQHRRLAEIIEMIHTASLIHDDVLDDSGMRRGKETIHQLYGTRVAVLAGDFMFAQSSWYLANLENIQVIKLISQLRHVWWGSTMYISLAQRLASQLTKLPPKMVPAIRGLHGVQVGCSTHMARAEVIKDFASGEIKQASSLFDCDITLDEYLLKSFYKTASLVAASTKSAAIFSSVSESICEQMYDYGKNLGLSFQVVDDILDFTQSAEQLGKPAGTDLAKGNLTAPVIFALEKEPKLREIIDSEFNGPGSLDDAIELVFKHGGIERALNLAREKANMAIQSLRCLPSDKYRSSLEGMVMYNLERID